uniref:Uncharacterized protein n=1 Tax=Strigamia maritima TaxID=126957 RepID=T1JLL9_STRMM
MAAPVIRTPFTDIFGRFFTNQGHGQCRDFELNFYECMEAYGLPRGWKKCDDYYEDFMECLSHDKRRKRIELMQAERLRQYKDGERDRRNYYAAPPKWDSYPRHQR